MSEKRNSGFDQAAKTKVQTGKPMQRLQNKITRRLMGVAICASLLLTAANAQAQQPRALAPGVLVTVPTNMEIRDSYSIPLSIPGLVADEYQPAMFPKKDTLHGSSQSIVLFRDVWQYEFSFMGLRQMKVRLKSGGQTVERNVWYMPYRVRDMGNAISYEQIQDKFQHTNFALRRSSVDGSGLGKSPIDIANPPSSNDPDETERIDREVARLTAVQRLTGAEDSNAPSSIQRDFIPRFSLQGWVENETEMQRVGYRDQILPAIVQLIREREDPNRVLLDTVQMSQQPIPQAQSVTDPGIWGVAVWMNVDPRIDYVSVVVSGLTNAYRLKSNDDGTLTRRARHLQLNFWRPGDAANQQDDDVRFGIPLVDDPAEQAEICYRYDLPGPLVRGYWESEKANQDILVVETDAQVNMNDFSSPLSPVLNGQPVAANEIRYGKMPAEIASSFANAGISIAADSPVVCVVPDVHWRFQDADGRIFSLRMEPQFWERDGEGGIRFIKGLDHLWIYR